MLRRLTNDGRVIALGSSTTRMLNTLARLGLAAGDAAGWEFEPTDAGRAALSAPVPLSGVEALELERVSLRPGPAQDVAQRRCRDRMQELGLMQYRVGGEPELTDLGRRSLEARRG